MSFNFEVIADQRVDDAYEKSDLLVAVSGVTSDRQPELIFDHVMSNVVISIISDDGYEDATLTLNALNNATCNLSTQTYTATGSTTTITAMKDVDTKYKSIIVPQEISANTLFATLTVGENVYEWTTLEAMAFESGYQYSYVWDLDINNFTPEGIINGWEGAEGEVSTDIIYSRLDDYNATSYPSTATTWVIYDVYASTDGFDGLQAALNAISVSEVDTRNISLEFPNLVSVPSSALSSNTNSSSVSSTLPQSTCLVSISLPSATSIGSSAFSYCTSLSNVYLPKVVSVGSDAFYHCSSLLELTLESIVSVGEESLSYITNLVSVSLPNATILEGSSLEHCSNLANIYIPNVTTLGNKVFNGCSSINTLSIPKFTTTTASGTNAVFYSGVGNLRSITLATESKIVGCNDLFAGLTTAYITLTIGKDNMEHVNGNVFTVFSSTSSTIRDCTFYEIIVTD
ncbi:MAG: fimbrillin family protein [Rikenellaceae bacterium]